MSAPLTPIKGVALDVDGVLTDGTFWWGAGGEEIKRFCFLDVMGISRAGKAGMTFALISGEDSPLVDRFAGKMSITHVYKGCKDKAAALRRFAEDCGFDLSQVCFMGDDINDLGAMELAGFTAAPSNAHASVKAKVRLVTQQSGGRGAVRELLDLLTQNPPSGPDSRA